MMHIVRIPQTQQTKSKMLSPKYIYWSQFEKKNFILYVSEKSHANMNVWKPIEKKVVNRSKCIKGYEDVKLFLSIKTQYYCFKSLYVRVRYLRKRFILISCVENNIAPPSVGPILFQRIRIYYAL